MRNRLGNMDTTQLCNEISSFIMMYTNQFGAFENDKEAGPQKYKNIKRRKTNKKKKIKCSQEHIKSLLDISTHGYLNQ